jgi:methionine--tRNA ligase beta chain
MSSQARRLKELRAKLGEDLVRLSALRKEAEDIRAAREKELQDLRTEEQRSDRLVASLQKDKAKYQKQLETKRKQVEALNREIERIIAQAVEDARRKEEAAAEEKTGFFTPNEKIDFSNVAIEPLFEESVDFETFSKSDFRAVKVKACQAVPKSKKLLQFTLDDGTGTDRTILSGIHAYYEPEELVGKTLVAITNLPPRAMMGIESCGMLLSAVNNKKDSDEEELHLLMIDNHIPAGAKLY